MGSTREVAVVQVRVLLLYWKGGSGSCYTSHYQAALRTFSCMWKYQELLLRPLLLLGRLFYHSVPTGEGAFTMIPPFAGWLRGMFSVAQRMGASA